MRLAARLRAAVCIAGRVVTSSGARSDVMIQLSASFNRAARTYARELITVRSRAVANRNNHFLSKRGSV